jgi:hypothetical protein
MTNLLSILRVIGFPVAWEEASCPSIPNHRKGVEKPPRKSGFFDIDILRIIADKGLMM